MSRVLKPLRERSEALGRLRAFFRERGLFEADVPMLYKAASVDAHIDLFHDDVYFHSSPEYGLKRLLAQGYGDMYFLGKVFRKGEAGRLHNPEFSLIEFYRCGWSLEELMEETLDLISLFVPVTSHSILSYEEAMERYAGISPWSSSQDLRKRIEQESLDPLEGDRDDLLNQIMGLIVEPQLGQDGCLFLTDYPASQAALASTYIREGREYARRFEVYWKGMELANGYDELSDGSILRERFQAANKKRKALQKESLPLDEAFLKAVDSMPACCGVALGFDRLLLLSLAKSSLREVMPFSWEEL